MNIKKFLGKQQVRIVQGKGYISIVEFFLVILLAIKSYNITDILIVPIMIGCVFSIWLLGYIDDKYGLFRKELEYRAKINPIFNETLEKVRRIEKMLIKNKEAEK